MRAAATSTDGTSWRSAFINLRMPLPLCAEPSRTCGADQAVAQFFREVIQDVLGVGRLIGEQLLHQRIVVVGDLLQHVEACFLLAVEIAGLHLDRLGRSMRTVDVGPLEREIDEAGC